MFCLPEHQQITVPDNIKNDENFHFNEGFPDLDKLSNYENSIFILDDLMSEINHEVMNLFIRFSHHHNISVVLLVHNIFFAGNKFFRTISLNSHYIVIMKNPRDRKQISILASQIKPENINFIKESFADATKEPFSFLLFDLTQKCPENFRLRRNIFPDSQPRNIIYIAKQKTKP